MEMWFYLDLMCNFIFEKLKIENITKKFKKNLTIQKRKYKISMKYKKYE